MAKKIERKYCEDCKVEIMLNRWLPHLGSKMHRKKRRFNAEHEKGDKERNASGNYDLFG